MRKIEIKKLKEAGVVVATLLVLLGIVLIQKPWQEDSVAVSGSSTVSREDARYVVVIDAGHGGRDGGKVSVDGVTYEKDINLEIAYKLKTYLEAQGVLVVMTREGDEGLYTESDSNKKAADLKRRIELINQVQPDLVISIHQNSYHEPEISGAQVFYYTTSESSKELAQIIQAQLCVSLDPDNHRQAKANDTYYMLKKTGATIVIVECGFLSNPEEAALLKSEEYQNRVAWNIYLGVMQYLNRQQNS